MGGQREVFHTSLVPDAAISVSLTDRPALLIEQKIPHLSVSTQITNSLKTISLNHTCQFIPPLSWGEATF